MFNGGPSKCNKIKILLVLKKQINYIRLMGNQVKFIHRVPRFHHFNKAKVVMEVIEIFLKETLALSVINHQQNLLT